MQRLNPKKPPPPTESAEQITLFQWAAWRVHAMPELALLYHIPNGGHRLKTTARRLKDEGVKAGVPDLCLPVSRAGFHGLYIELKRTRGNTATEKQEEWIAALDQQGYKTAVCFGWEAAAMVIEEYLKAGAGISFTERETELIELTAITAVTKVYNENAGGQLDHYRIIEKLLYNYKRLATLVCNDEEYLSVEHHEKSKSVVVYGSGSYSPDGVYEEMAKVRLLSYETTVANFRDVEKVIDLFRARKEFIVIRMYYFGENADGGEREAAQYTWEEIAVELSTRGILKDEKTARRWRTNLINDIAVCMFGKAAAMSLGSNRRKTG